MKKLPFRRKKELKKQVTTETIEDHREEVLSRGRKFKYPFQYAKHRLVINTVIIGVVAVGLMVLFAWLMLYRFQSTDDVLYRFTKFIPVPVADVDGERVRYSDYLMIYKSSLTALESQEGVLTGSDEDKAIRSQYQRRALDNAVEFAYALKLARELGVEVAREEVVEAEREHRTVDGVERSEESFAKIIQTNFGLSVGDYERLLLLSLTRRAVAAEIDSEALVAAERVEALMLEYGGDFVRVAEALGGAAVYEETGDLVSNMNLDGGRATVASGMEVGAWSGRLLSKNGDGFYFVKTLGKSDGQVKYASLRVPFTEFNNRMRVLREEGKVHEYIEIELPVDGGGEDKT